MYELHYNTAIIYINRKICRLNYRKFNNRYILTIYVHIVTSRLHMIMNMPTLCTMMSSIQLKNMDVTH